MIDSIYLVIVGPSSLEVLKPPISISNFNILFFVIGCTLVLALEKLKELLKNKSVESEIE